MPINHDDEYHTDHPWPKDVYWQEVTSFKPCKKEDNEQKTTLEELSNSDYPNSWQAAAVNYGIIHHLGERKHPPFYSS